MFKDILPDMVASEYAERKRWDRATLAEPTAIENAYFDAEFALALERLVGFGRDVRLLELGFGSGALLSWARVRGFERYGIEADPVLLDLAERCGVRAFPSLAQALAVLESAAVHLIAAFDVLEHIPQDRLPEYMVGIERLLVPGGIFIARFPNGDSPFGLALQNGDLTHVTAIGSRKISHLASLSRLEVLDIRNPAQPSLGPGLRGMVRRHIANGLRSVIERAVGSLYYGGRRISLAANLVALLQKPTISAP